MLNCEFKKSDDGGAMLVAGELTAKHAAELRNAFVKALVDADRIDMDFGNVTAADLSCLQLLCSAHRTAQRLNKRLCFVGRAPDALTAAMEEAGFPCFAGCSLDCGRGCGARRAMVLRSSRGPIVEASPCLGIGRRRVANSAIGSCGSRRSTPSCSPFHAAA